MDQQKPNREPAHAALVAIISLLLAFAVLNLWKTDLSIPMGSSGDGLLHLTMVKATVQQGWPLTIDRLGAPGKLDFRDFPALDNFNLLLVRFLSLFSREPGLLINSLFLLTFPLVAVLAYLVSRRLGLSVPASYLVAILYALLPYHFRRGVGHLFLSAYYFVPPAILIAFELSRGAEVFAGTRRWRALGFAVIFCIALGSATVYYAFFAAIFFLAGGVSGAIARRAAAPLLIAAALIGVVVATLAANHIPTIIKESREGSLNVAKRVPAEAELYGLKITQLVLPITEHRFPPFKWIKWRYNAAPLVSENDTASLGLIGTAGFVLLFIWLFYLKPPAHAMNGGHALLNHFSVMNAAAVLVGTIGGLSSIFSLLISPQIRSVNRISVFIAFFSLVAAGVVFDRMTSRWKLAPTVLFAAGLTLAGVTDQTNSTFRHHPSNDRQGIGRYAARVEAMLPKESTVFQLPYFPFPEHGKVHELWDYDPLRAYVYSDKLRFSYGAVRGSHADLWQKYVSSMPPQDMARTLALAGFDAIWIERGGFEDKAAALERELAVTVGAIPFASEDGARSVVSLVDLRRRLALELGPRLAEESEDARSPLLVGWSGGFYGEERSGDETWRWCQREGILIFYNHPRRSRKLVQKMRIASTHPEPSAFHIRSSFWREDLLLTDTPQLVERTLIVPPGVHRVSLRSEARGMTAQNDPRHFVFRVVDFSIREIADARPSAAEAPLLPPAATGRR